MAKLAIDLSGRGGLGPGYAGDLNDTTPKPNLRYMGGQSQVADGIYDPLRVLGYMAPANDTFTILTGTPTNEIIARVYDSSSDKLFFMESSQYIASISGLDGTTFTETNAIGANPFRDIELYQINNQRALLYAWFFDNTNGPDSIILGFTATDSTRGAFPLAARVWDSGVPTSNELISSAGNQKLAQKFSTADTSSISPITFSGVRLRVGLNSAVNFQVGIQSDTAGRPSGTYVSTIATISSANTNFGTDFAWYQFPSTVTLSPLTTYHIVVEPVSALGGSDTLTWMRSTSTNSLYANGEAEQYIGGAWANAAATSESFDFALVINTASFVTGPTGVGAGSVLNAFTTNRVFLVKADNGLLYVFADNQVHKFDGGASGGNVGTATADVLEFPTFLTCADAVDTNSVMYIAIQSSGYSTTADYRTFGADTMGVYAWDRLTTIASTRNFIPIYGAREIRRIFVNADGDLRVITIGEDRFTEIRGIVNGKLEVLQRLDIDAYPPYRDSVDFMNNMAVWTGANGTIYALGRLPENTTEQVYKIGKINGYTGTLTPGVIAVGNKETTQAREGVFVTWKDTSPTKKIQKWYPHGTGTINSVAQKGNQGDVYSLVQHMPYLSDVHHLMITCAPNGIAADATTVATLKFYKNMETSPFMTKVVTRNDTIKGFLSYEINKSYVNAFQIEVEYPTSQTLGTNDFLPAFGVLDYTATNTLK